MCYTVRMNFIQQMTSGLFVVAGAVSILVLISAGILVAVVAADRKATRRWERRSGRKY